MEKIIGYCGITCSECPAYKATIKNDEKEKEIVAKMWSKQFNMDIKPESINCFGCTSLGKPLSGYCLTCNIRKCALEKGIESCAFCSGYSCGTLSAFVAHIPQAQENLKAFRDQK